MQVEATTKFQKKIVGPEVYPDNVEMEALTLGKYYTISHCHYAYICFYFVAEMMQSESIDYENY